MGVVKLRVAICGGGIAGLAHACALARYPDISVNIYESTDKFSPFGAGIGVWPRAWNVLCALGLGEDMTKITSGSPTSSPVQSFSFRKSDQPSGFTFGNMFSRGPLLTFHRAQFQEVLVRHLPPSCRIHHSKRLKSYSQGRLGCPIRLLFEDGTYATCDVLVGADGIKSAVRNCLLQDQTEIARESGRPTDEQKTLTCKDHVSWAGSIAYRALIPVEKLKEDCDQGLLVLPVTPTMYVGTDVHMVVYPVSKGQEVNLALFHFRPELQGMPFHGPWSKGVDESELFDIAHFESWEPEVQRWLKYVRRPTKWAIHTVVDLPTFTSGRAVLIGDAAHSCTPHQGTGAGQAIEDAYFLAELLGDPRTTLNTVQQALKIYDKFRRPWTQDASAKAMANGRYFTLHYDGFDFVHADAAAVVQKLHQLSDVMIDEWKWCWTTTVEDSLKAALSQLQYA
ncbi:FAD/NAD(P)-binding domain-containing protein [Lentinula lateritia]|uniref:FAD/NAD(P)-binding domain-containing protein n=1 Tax=Lentinula aff. lateritia TaxID=2804960 RepID=A0ACC1TSU4_9AGAR|nr:FAD/NAD(P)-binding domain-containing protein [Lentinula aff. lateritia]KAJ3849146.1 FAD/NAD(P)-binding domain-containing protein [Lentinula lateritia]